MMKCDFRPYCTGIARIPLRGIFLIAWYRYTFCYNGENPRMIIMDSQIVGKIKQCHKFSEVGIGCLLVAAFVLSRSGKRNKVTLGPPLGGTGTSRVSVASTTGSFGF